MKFVVIIWQNFFVCRRRKRGIGGRDMAISSFAGFWCSITEFTRGLLAVYTYRFGLLMVCTPYVCMYTMSKPCANLNA